jgi:hypothetical protein
MKAPWKPAMLLMALMLLSSVSPLLAVGEPTDTSEDRQGEALNDEDTIVQYAILTSFAFVDEFQRLADWKTEKGVYTKVYPSDWVKNHYPGPDPQAQYHNFLRDLYNHTDGGLSYLLIGADHEVIKSRQLWTGNKGWAYSGPTVYSDHYYAGLDHDWDANGNGKYGETVDPYREPDWDAEISVGRAPVSNVDEASNVVDKLLAYEKDPQVGDWMRTAVLASSVMNPPNANISTAHKPSDIYNWWEDNGWESIQRTLPMIPGNMDKHIIYDYDQIEGGNYTPENDTLNRSSYFAAMNMGSSIMVSVTHGWIPTGNGIPHYTGDGIGFNWTTAFYYNDVPRMTNANETPFIYFSSCYVGNFTELNDTNFELLLTKPDGGAIGFIAPTENTYRGEENPAASDGNWWMSETFWKHVLKDGMRPGDALYQMVREYEPHLRTVGANPDHPFFQQNHAAYNLIGDPEMPVWLDLPRDLVVRTPDEIFDIEYEVQVRVTEGAIPVEGARVCFKGEDFYAYGDTDADGWATVTISPTEVGQTVMVTASKPGYRYFQRTMGVTPVPAELKLISQTIHASEDRPEAGQPTTLSAEVRNIGHTDALSFAVQFYDGEPGANDTTEIGGPVDVPGLPSGLAATVSAQWNAPTVGFHEIYVVADVNNDIPEVLKSNNVGSSSVYVSAVNARADGMALAGDATALPFGVEAEVHITVASTGTMDLPPVTVRLFLGDPGAGGVIVGTDRVTPPISAGSSSTITFTYTPAQVGSFKLYTQVDPDDEVWEFDETDNQAELSIRVGHPPIWGVIPGVQMLEDSTKVIDLTRYITDYDTQVADVEVSIDALTTNRATVTVDGLVVTIVPDHNWFGQFDIAMEVDDGDFSVVTQFHVTVDARNDPPVFNNTDDNFNLVEGERWFYEFDVSDPDGEPVHFSDNSEMFDITSDGVIDYTPSFEDISYSPIHVFRIIATDGTARSFYPMTLQFEAANTAPELDLPDRLFAVEGVSFSYLVRAWDREGDNLEFSDDSELFDIFPTTGQMIFTAVNDNVGKHQVNITVSDGEFTTNATVEFYIYEAPFERRENLEEGGWAVLAAQVALILVGLLYLGNLRRRQAKEAREKEPSE